MTNNTRLLQDLQGICSWILIMLSSALINSRKQGKQPVPNNSSWFCLLSIMPLPSIIETKASKYINHQHAIAQSKCKPKALRLNAPYFSWLEAAMRCKYNVTFCRLTHSKHTNTWCKCGIPRQDMPKQEQTMQSWNMLVRKAMLLLRQRPLCQTSQFHAGLPSIPS